MPEKLFKEYLLPISVFPNIDSKVLDILRSDIELIQNLFLHYFLEGYDAPEVWEDLYSTFGDVEWLGHSLYDANEESSIVEGYDYYTKLIEHLVRSYELFIVTANRSLGFLKDNSRIDNFFIKVVDKYSLLLTIAYFNNEQNLLPFISSEDIPF